MATTLLRSPNYRPPPPLSTNSSFKPIKASSSFQLVRFRNVFCSKHCGLHSHFLLNLPRQHRKFVTFASSSEEATETETEQIQQPQNQEQTDEGVSVESAEEISNDDGEPVGKESPSSPVITTLQMYKKALNDSDEPKIAELEEFFKSVEEVKDGLERKVASLSEDLSVERERVLRISADFDNFRKRTERERLSLVANAQGEVIENFLPVLDNFERAKSQIKIGSEAEEKISNSYQSIYKQFIEILGSIGVMPVETLGKPFDPLMHEAIMRDESTEYDDGVIIEEFRKGFKLGDRLLRPSMVKVSAGPGPQKLESSEPAIIEEDAGETSEDAGGVGDSNEQTAP